MRVKAGITAQDLSLPMAQQGFERYVPLGLYVPIETKLTSFFFKIHSKRTKEYIAGLIRAFSGNFDDPRGSDIGLRNAIERGPTGLRSSTPPRRWSRFFSFAPQPGVRRADPYPASAGQAAKDLEAAITSAQSTAQQIQAWNAFEHNPAMRPAQSAIDKFWGQYGLINLTSRVGTAIRNIVRPVGRPEFTSELGLMYLDRTAVKRGNFELGERLYVLTLGPGEETTLEKRVVQKSSLSFEEAFERDLESKLEADTETTDTTNTSDTLTTAEKTSRNTTVDSDLDLQVPGGSIPVNGKIGVQQSDQFDTATDEANTQSRNIAVRATQRISSSLRTQHKTTFKETRESSLETLTRRVIRNPNPEAAVDLVYFKVMEKLSLQQERTGIRLCWAPFIADPASRVRQRMKAAYQTVIDERLSRLSLPQPPMPPAPETKPVWVSSDRQQLMLDITKGCLDRRDLYVPISKSDFFTGNLRASIEWNGDTPRGSAWVVHSSSSQGVVDDPEGFKNMFPELSPDDYSGYVKIAAEANIPPALISGLIPYLVAEAEVLRASLVYAEVLAAYLQVKQQYDLTVAVMKNEAIKEAEPAALEAMAEVLRSTDVRAELMHAVMIQYIAPGLSRHRHGYRALATADRLQQHRFRALSGMVADRRAAGAGASFQPLHQRLVGARVSARDDRP